MLPDENIQKDDSESEHVTEGYSVSTETEGPFVVQKWIVQWVQMRFNLSSVV